MDAAELLAAVEQSPRAVAAHDRAAWVGLFAPAATVEDPVGSRPHVGAAAIGPFYDTFIGPNGIVFRVDHDVVCGQTVWRDLTVETTMSTGVTLRVPMHLRYDLDDELKIARLRAYWELPLMIGQLLGAGVSGLGAGVKLVPQLLGNQGLGGAAGFARAFVRVGAAGKRVAVGLLDAAARGDLATVRKLLAPGAVIEWPAGTAVDAGEFVERAHGVRPGKTIGAGRFVTVSVAGPSGPGVVELELGPRDRQITAVRGYLAR